MNTIYIHQDQGKDGDSYKAGGLLYHEDDFSFDIEAKHTHIVFFDLTAKQIIDLGHAIHDLGTQAMEMEEAADGKD